MTKKKDTLSQDTIDYMNGVWGFSTGEDNDDMNMLWHCGYYEAVVRRLVEAGAVEDNGPEAHEILQVAKTFTDEDMDDAISVCLQDYTVFECSKCEAVHFINNLYVDEAHEWSCDSCARGNLKRSAA
jgi:hypothetical protein